MIKQSRSELTQSEHSQSSNCDRCSRDQASANMSTHRTVPGERRNRLGQVALHAPPRSACLVEGSRWIVDLRPDVGEGDALADAVLKERDGRAYACGALALLLHNVLDALDVDALLLPHMRWRISHHELAPNHVAWTVGFAVRAVHTTERNKSSATRMPCTRSTTRELKSRGLSRSAAELLRQRGTRRGRQRGLQRGGLRASLSIVTDGRCLRMLRIMIASQDGISGWRLACQSTRGI